MTTSPRPDLKPVMKQVDYFIEIFALIALVFVWFIAIKAFYLLPEVIPTHFNYKSEIDNHGSKGIIFIMPVVYSFIYLLLSFINRKPSIFNYPVTITTENAAIQYNIAARFIRVLKALIGLMLIYISWMIVYSAKNGVVPFGDWVIFVLMGSIFIPIIVYVIVARKNR